MIMPVLQKQLQSATYNMPGVRVDGMDVVEVYKAQEVERAKMVKALR